MTSFTYQFHEKRNLPTSHATSPKRYYPVASETFYGSLWLGTSLVGLGGNWYDRWIYIYIGEGAKPQTTTTKEKHQTSARGSQPFASFCLVGSTYGFGACCEETFFLYKFLALKKLASSKKNCTIQVKIPIIHPSHLWSDWSTKSCTACEDAWITPELQEPTLDNDEKYFFQYDFFREKNVSKGVPEWQTGWWNLKLKNQSGSHSCVDFGRPSVFFVSIGNRGICHSWIAGKTHPAASMAACTQLSRNLGMNDHLGTTGLKCQQQHHSKWIRTRITGWSLWVHRIYATSIMKFWGWGGSLNEMFYFPLLVVGNRFPGKNRPWKTMILSYLKWPPLLEGTYPPGN